MKERLESLYTTYNRSCYIHPDPLEWVYRFEEKGDREIAGFIASAFAFGRVGQILITLERVFRIMGPSPSSYLGKATRQSLKKDFNGFVYRFVRGHHLADFLYGLSCVIKTFGSLERCFDAGLSHECETVIPAMAFLAKQFRHNGFDPGYLLADPQKGSACKRMCLFLRWMAREDDVDPGLWAVLSPERLIIPLDTHMHAIARTLCLTSRGQADMRTALQVTGAFAGINGDDPVKYDFTLTRFGIRDDLCLSQI